MDDPKDIFYRRFLHVIESCFQENNGSKNRFADGKPSVRDLTVEKFLTRIIYTVSDTEGMILYRGDDKNFANINIGDKLKLRRTMPTTLSEKYARHYAKKYFLKIECPDGTHKTRTDIAGVRISEFTDDHEHILPMNSEIEISDKKETVENGKNIVTYTGRLFQKEPSEPVNDIILFLAYYLFITESNELTDEFNHSYYERIQNTNEGEIIKLLTNTFIKRVSCNTGEFLHEYDIYLTLNDRFEADDEQLKIASKYGFDDFDEYIGVKFLSLLHT